MKNVSMRVEGSKLILEVDLTQTFGPSSTGKTVIVASTEGNKSVPGTEIKIGLNAYKYPIPNRLRLRSAPPAGAQPGIHHRRQR